MMDVEVRNTNKEEFKDFKPWSSTVMKKRLPETLDQNICVSVMSLYSLCFWK